MRFESIRVVIGEPNRQMRQSVKTALIDKGFRNIVDVASAKDVGEAIKTGDVDLLVCDMGLPDGSLCEIIRKCRHHEIGPNPFILVITLLENPTVAVVKQAFDAGTDDLIVKPFAPKQLLDRVLVLARGRKPFVVTHDYIGPDRRKTQRDGDGVSATLIEVPNPLRAKAMGEMNPERLQQLIDSAAIMINEQKMERHAVQIAYLIDRILPTYEGGGGPHLDQLLEQLLYVAEDLSRRLRGTRYSHVAELAMSLVGLTMRVRQAGNRPDQKDMDLLPKLCLAIERAFSRDARTADVAKQISQAVGNATGGAREFR